MRTMLMALALAAAALASPAAGADVARGAGLYGLWCGGCHDPVGDKAKTMPGTYALDQRYKGARPAALVDRNDLTPGFVRSVVRGGVNIMPAFRKTELNDAELDDVAAYLSQRPTPAAAAR